MNYRMSHLNRFFVFLFRVLFCFLPFFFKADVTPERQAVLDRLSNGQVFPASSQKVNGNGGGTGNGGKDGDGSGGGGFGNGVMRLPGDPPAQPNFVGGPRCAKRRGRWWWCGGFLWLLLKVSSLGGVLQLVCCCRLFVELCFL